MLLAFVFLALQLNSHPSLCRFLGTASVGSLVQATLWLLAVGFKPVYVFYFVGPDFYKEVRVGGW